MLLSALMPPKNYNIMYILSILSRSNPRGQKTVKNEDPIFHGREFLTGFGIPIWATVRQGLTPFLLYAQHRTQLQPGQRGLSDTQSRCALAVC